MTYQENLADGRDDTAAGVIQKPIADDKTFEPPVDDSEPGPTRPDPTDGDGDLPGQDGSDLLIVNNGDGSVSEIAGGRGIDILMGGSGEDIWPAMSGDDGVLFGGSGNDVLLGEDGRDGTTANDGDRSSAADDLLDHQEPPSDPNQPTRPDPGDAEGPAVEEAVTFNFAKIGVMEDADSAAMLPGDSPPDLLIVNNGDGADFLEDETLDINLLSGNDPKLSDDAYVSEPRQSGGAGNDIVLGETGADPVAGSVGEDLFVRRDSDVSIAPLTVDADTQETADQFVFDTHAGDANAANEAFFVKADAETTTQAGATGPDDLDGIDAASGFTPLIAFAPNGDAPLDLGVSEGMTSFDDIM